MDLPLAADGVAVLVPVKAFAQAKLRLTSVLSPAERADLARTMADRVVAAAGSLPVAVVCDDAAVRTWAEGLGASVLWHPGRGLNGAVSAGVADLAEQGVSRVIVAHADLPLAKDLAWVADADGVTLVPDRHDDGTNVLSIPTGCGFTFCYGAGSFRAHATEAERCGLPVRVVRDADLGWDVDVPADLGHPDMGPLVTLP